MEYTFSLLASDKNIREKFFAEYDGLIKACKSHGLMDAALMHAKFRKKLLDELSLLDE